MMLLLWSAWAGMLFGGFAFGQLNTTQTHRIPTPLRMGSSAMLVLAAWFYHLSQPEVLHFWLAVGMSLGFLGDLFMAGLLIKGDRRVLGGMSAFGLGHIAYITGLLNHNSLMTNDRWVILGIWWILAVVLWYWVVLRGAHGTPNILHYAALPYALLLASTTGVASGLAITESAFILLTIGTILFLLSDLLLAAELFNGLHFKGIGDAVWLMYGPGQMLIVFALYIASL
ncbi:MAG: lysoplasmalogenase [Phototrophicales bacterium]|nr:MAG: lysoplasmalogenase [Phototrophicales bacterium]